MKSLIINILHYLNLDGEIDDYDKIHQSIQKDIIFKGTNLWILIFAIIVASVGLNMNSTAVIIGAMLISPLMGPINGMGYSIATYDFHLFRISVKNFSFAVFASLAASTLYFAISPISTAHSELLARTSPTIYDVLIALFGGLAGIVAISSRNKGNVIPGVAIATALMPPLCTAGYGIATAQFDFFFGAIYLFTINTVFIAISSVLISQILNFPIRTLVDEKKKKRVNSYISTVIALVLIPSIFFGYQLVQRERFIDNASRYVNNISIFEGSYLLKHEINEVDKLIKLVYGGADFSEDQKQRIRQKAIDFDLNDVKIEFQQGFSFDVLTTKNTEVENLRFELNLMRQLVNEKDRLIEDLTAEQNAGKDLFAEIVSLFPQVSSLSYAEQNEHNKSAGSPVNAHVVVIGVNKSTDLSSQDDKTRIENWLKVKLKSDRVRVFYVTESSD